MLRKAVSIGDNSSVRSIPRKIIAAILLRVEDKDGALTATLSHFAGDIEDCLVAPVSQGQFTPLPEALCWAILELTSQRQAATLDTLRSALRNAFPAMQRPSRELVYDALAKLMQERKIYHTSQGYFVVTPETKRLRRDSGSSRRCSRDVNGSRGQGSMLMSNDEAVALVHGEMLTLRDGDVTHQAVQTNLADVICGGTTSSFFLSRGLFSEPDVIVNLVVMGKVHNRLTVACT